MWLYACFAGERLVFKTKTGQRLDLFVGVYVEAAGRDPFSQYDVMTLILLHRKGTGCIVSFCHLEIHLSVVLCN